ncbi:uncharacterized protein LOC113553118 [Rhopalosiphum maidis]|uniref:uncharacterized protein LOC113553118 n=1 Tax=Rhopalosiphum maidis TaxID=43146 RepID=UPI000EFFF7E4|nr:uncharacterized protein LOC113553118 [Rhopalosiphum maidis]
MNIIYAKGIVVLIVLACVLHTNCARTEKSSSKLGNNSKLKKSTSNLSNDEKNNGSIEQMLLNIATIIQGCIDEKTMNNKEFKTKLDNLYKNLVNKKIKNKLKTYTKKAMKIKQQYEDDVKVLEIMKSGAGSENSKTKNKPKKSKSFK